MDNAYIEKDGVRYMLGVVPCDGVGIRTSEIVADIETIRNAATFTISVTEIYAAMNAVADAVSCAVNGIRYQRTRNTVSQELERLSRDPVM